MINSVKVTWRLQNLVCPICEKENTNCSYFDNTPSPNRYSCLTEVRNHKNFNLLREKNGFYIYSEKADNRSFSKAELSSLNKYLDQPSEPEIHGWYLEMIENLTLNNAHKALLNKRGIGFDQAIQLGFRTLPANYKLGFENKLSGFKDNLATNFNDVLLIPCYSFDGLFVGYQLRTDSDKNKYIWGNGDYSAHNSSGKLPVSVTRFNDQPVNELWVTEGYLKATVTSVKFDKVVLGCGGGTLDRTRELRETVIDLEVNKVVIFPDAGSAINPSISSNNIRHFKSLLNLGCEVYFGDYGQFYDKSIGDIDDQDGSLEFKLVGIQEYVNSQALINVVEGVGLKNKPQDSFEDYNGSFEVGKKYNVKSLTEAYESLVNQNIRVIHDCSSTGAGKSHAVSNISLAKMFATPAVNPKQIKINEEGDTRPKDRQLIYGVSSPRNPSIDKIAEDFALLEGRHDGLYLGQDGRLKTTTPEGSTVDAFKASNCAYSKLFQLARTRGTPTTSICGKCDFRKECKVSEGDGYGYRKNYIKAVTAPKIVTNPTSIPQGSLDENDVVIIDEFTSINSITSHSFDLNILVGKALKSKDYHLAEFFNQLNGIKSDTNLSGTFYDAISEGILERIKKLADKEETTVANNEQAIIRLFTEKWKSGMNKGKYNLMQDAELTIEYAYFNNLHTALTSGQFSVAKKGSKLEISCVNEAIKANVRQAGTVIIQDATTTTEEIADFFGVSVDEIVTIRIQTPQARTRNIHVTGLGKLTTRRSAMQVSAINALRTSIPEYLNLDESEIGFIDYGRFAKGSDLTFFSTARGSNDFAAKKALVLIGTPLTNLGAVLTRFEVLKGRASSFEDEEFKVFYAQKTNEEAIQAVGRLRASRRLEETLTVIVLGDANLDFLGTMERIQACDIDPTVATRQARVDKRVKACQEYVAINGKPTQKDLANHLKLSLSALTKWVKRQFESWTTFLDSLVVQFDGFEGIDDEQIVSQVQSMRFLSFGRLLKVVEPNLNAYQLKLAYNRLELLREVSINSPLED